MRDGWQRVRAEIDLSAIAENMERMHENLRPQTQMAAVVKADAYGHGAVPVAAALERLPFLWGFATATFEEALALRQAGIKKPVLVLGYVFPYCYEALAREEIRPAVFREDMVPELGAAARRAGKTLRVHIAVDTGMSRIGVTPDERGLAFVRRALAQEGLFIEGIFTHFARADEADKTSARGQFARFDAFTKMIYRQTGYAVPLRHAANSASILELTECQENLVRAGITMYGLLPSGEVSPDAVPLRPALSLKSHIVYCKEAEAGVPVSYGGTFVTNRRTRIATIPVGYGDGYPRGLSGRGCVLIGGQRAPILGRVCMDQFMVDVTDIPQAREGSEVVLIGRNGGDELTVESLAALSGRFHYELVCDLNRRVPRVYYENGREIAVAGPQTER